MSIGIYLYAVQGETSLCGILLNIGVLKEWLGGSYMEDKLKGTQKLMNYTYSAKAFGKRMIMVLTALIVISSAVVFLLIYLPSKAELEKSLMKNFNQLSYIRYTSLQNNMNRGLEGARSLSSRTVIRDVILDYKDGKMNLDNLITVTQSKYEDGAKALEYLLKAERFVDDDLIARYAVNSYDNQPCTVWDRLKANNETSSALCLTDDYKYFVIRSPILSQEQVIGYDQLTFDLGAQIDTLCTKTIKSELLYHDKFEDLILGANMLQNNNVSSFFYRDGIYYQAFHLQDDAHFITSQSEIFLLDPVNRFSKRILLAGIGVPLAFSLAVYFFIIRHAKDEVEDSRCTAREAMLEAITDPLTKAGSRRLGEELLSASFERFQKGETSPAILLFDIDFLKEVNDMHGHSTGDKVIRYIAEAVHKSIRSEDILLRWGGDEFVGIFDGLGKQNALSFAQKLLNAVSSLAIETETKTIRPAISIGISYFEKEDRTFIDAVNRADRAMYQSKTEGRNKAHKL